MSDNKVPEKVDVGKPGGSLSKSAVQKLTKAMEDGYRIGEEIKQAVQATAETMHQVVDL